MNRSTRTRVLCLLVGGAVLGAPAGAASGAPARAAVALGIPPGAGAWTQADPLMRHQMADVDPVPDDEAYGPTPLPDRVNLTWADDPATTQAVTWRTDESVDYAFAEIAPATDGALFRYETVRATTTELDTNLGTGHYHTVEFRDLEPATQYIYRVGDGVNWSEWFQFRTAADTAAPFTFVYMGDSQEDVRSQWSRVVRQAFMDAPGARFFLYTGDMVDDAHDDAQWGEWFAAQGWLSGTVPVVPAPGNHEYEDDRLADQWRPQFALPQNGPEGLEEAVYYLDYQELRVIVLSSTALQRYGQGPTQARWLEDVLADNPARWTAVAFHHPVFATRDGEDNADVRGLWRPLFERYRVDLVLQGHDHTYARTGASSGEYRIADEPIRFDPAAGTVYVISSAGPKTRDLRRGEWMARAGEDLQLYQIIEIDGDVLRYESRTATGRLYDAFTLRKRPGEPNEIAEQIPAGVEEALRPTDSNLPSTMEPYFHHGRRVSNPPR